ncbi:MAG: cardiolipin synthase [Rhizobiaceae bacterium]|nr:cardiolipin synthase [Rhizobiaceae bacterium]
MLIPLHFVIQALLILRVLLRRHRAPISRLAWIVVILALPIIGIMAYLLLGETNIGRKRVERMKRVLAQLPDFTDTPGLEAVSAWPHIPEQHAPLFKVGQSISGFEPVAGNLARLTRDSDAAISAMVADIDAAKDHVHLLFYIWLPDGNGTRIAEALKRAASRGVTCRAMVDDLGSRTLVQSDLWQEMEASGIRLARALPVGNPLLRVFNGRIDLRNHRKILVIDNEITYCGSQNCADPQFLPKAKYAPWVDCVMRFEGPIVRQNQYVFAADWMAEVNEDLSALLKAPVASAQTGFPAQVIASGPTARFSAMPEMFETLMYSAQRELFITTPYYVPIESMQAALCAAANRGIDTTIILPQRNDDFAVGATSRSYYEELLDAGVKIHEFGGGLLHAKTMTIDGDVTLIGSANMDRRSFDLNYENNILLHDRNITEQMRQRQESYLADCRQVSVAEVAAWPWHHRLWNNTMAILGPVL